MKMKSLMLKLVVLLVVCGSIVALLEVFGLHPEFNCGRFHSTWLGVRHMKFESGAKFVSGHGMAGRAYEIGPVRITIDT